MAVLGIDEKLSRGTLQLNNPWVRMIKVTASESVEVDEFWFAGCGLCSLGSSAAKCGIWKTDGTLVPNSVFSSGTGSYHYKHYLYWRNYAYVTKPVLTAGDYYIGIVGNSDNCASAAPWPYEGSRWIANVNYDNPGNLSSISLDSDTQTISMYLVATAAELGPSIKVDGITPGKIEQVSWSDVADVQ